MKLQLKLATLAALLLAVVPQAKATITINFGAGDLRNTTGTTLVPVGGLLQLVADTTRNGFSAPTSSAFSSGDDLVIASFALNGFFNGAGTTASTLTITPGNFSGLDAGDPLIFRWFPTLTTASTTPGLGTTYGQFRVDTNQDGSNLSPAPWAEPADGASYSLNFLTASEGGANANVLGFATNVVVGVPEPSTWAMLGLGTVGLAAYGLRRRRATV